MSRFTHKPTGWNTWDFRGFNRLVYLRNGRTELAVQYAIWDEHVSPPSPESRQLGRLHDTFRWTDTRVLGPHGGVSLPAVLEFAVGEARYLAQATVEAGALRLSIRPLTPTTHRIVFLFIAPVGEAPSRSSATAGKFAGWNVELEGATWPTNYFLNLSDPYAVAPENTAASLVIRPARSTPPAIATVERYEKECLRGGGALADAPQAMIRAIHWNTLYDTRRKLASSPVSRDWCYDWRGVLVFCWDTFLVGQIEAYESPELAHRNFEAVLAAVDEIGHVPNYAMAHGAMSLDRSMPPLGAYMIWKAEQAHADRAWLAGIYPRLRKWHTYWMKHRDGNGDGLLEWGTDPTPRYEFPQLLPYNPSLQHTAKCAMYESGLDNSPMFDDVPFNTQANTLELADVALNSYYAMDCEALANIARVLGKDRDARAYQREYAQIRARINDRLWDEEHGLYANRHWDGRFSQRWSPTSFFPLIAGIAEPRQAERMVREHLLNPEEFWGQYVIPAIARSDPAFKDNDYWRGRIWGPFNFLVAEGLRRYRLDDVAADLAARGLAMFMENLRKDGGIYENYNATTGAGGDVWNAARLYHWGGLMAFIAIQELIDVEATGWLRFGSIDFPAASIHQARVGGAIYDVELADGLSVRCDGQPLLSCPFRAIVRLPLRRPDEPIEITARLPIPPGAQFILYQDGKSTPPPARVNGGAPIAPRPHPSLPAVVYTLA